MQPHHSGTAPGARPFVGGHAAQPGSTGGCPRLSEDSWRCAGTETVGDVPTRPLLATVRTNVPPRLFDAFFTTKPEGMGMGLSISRTTVEAHGGRLWATSNNGHGAIFQSTLPTGGERVL